MNFPTANFIHSQFPTNLKQSLVSQIIPANNHAIKEDKNPAQIAETAQSILLRPSRSVGTLEKSIIRKQPPKRQVPIRPDKIRGHSSSKERSQIPPPSRKAPLRPTAGLSKKVRQERRVQFKESDNQIIYFDVEEKPVFPKNPIILPAVPPLPPAFEERHEPLQHLFQTQEQAENIAPPKALKLPQGPPPTVPPRPAIASLNQAQSCVCKSSTRTVKKRRLTLNQPLLAGVD